MKPLLLLLLCAALGLLPVSAFGQVAKQVDRILNQKTTVVKRYVAQPAPGGRKIGHIHSKFNTETVKRSRMLDSVRTGIIERIEFVYTELPADSLFDQRHLNWQRLHQLAKVLPEAFAPTVAWRLFAQKGNGNAAELVTYFHGFVIYWKQPPSPESVAGELDFLEHLFGGKKDVAKIKTGDDRTTKASTPYLLYSSVINYGPDTVVQRVMRRNQQWQQMDIVCDVTGSMSPYTGQLLAWYKFTTSDKKVKRFVFFNDGNMQLDFSKRIGSTGGIYQVRASGFDSVYQVMRTAMLAGYGGDTPENNLEALLTVQPKEDKAAPGKMADTKSQLIMIADNWATPRDTSLLSQLKRPVRIILCGAQFFINPAYLNIARATGGSVHLMEKDLEDLAKLHEGETLVVGSKKFTLRDGKFIPEGSLMPVPCCLRIADEQHQLVVHSLGATLPMNSTNNGQDNTLPLPVVARETALFWRNQRPTVFT